MGRGNSEFSKPGEWGRPRGGGGEGGTMMDIFSRIGFVWLLFFVFITGMEIGREKTPTLQCSIG